MSSAWTRRRLTVVAVSHCLVMMLGSARSEDWPQFRGPRGSGHSSAKDLPLTWGGPNKENVLWSAELLGEGSLEPELDELVRAGFLIQPETKTFAGGLGGKERFKDPVLQV